jgi:hypothetical protein
LHQLALAVAQALVGCNAVVSDRREDHRLAVTEMVIHADAE